ncbi:lysine-rich arabinogalactan protein 19-like [Zingiber officinale]|uniref:lysine-rich arabinogalactan protein 19-like n=1 Tax=Zingiber officinale TaxID=94328 RepID=UPI001C4D70A7|nr:lysine-rich arabinogalactan protein 19-like [Zingiber officinale]
MPALPLTPPLTLPSPPRTACSPSHVAAHAPAACHLPPPPSPTPAAPSHAAAHAPAAPLPLPSPAACHHPPLLLPAATSGRQHYLATSGRHARSRHLLSSHRPLLLHLLNTASLLIRDRPDRRPRLAPIKG